MSKRADSPIDLFDLEEQVHDEKTFVDFLEVLMLDRLRSVELAEENPSLHALELGWENESIEDFLESAIAWARAPGWAEPESERAPNPWRLAAKIMHAGKIYE